jgi:hypothetical protein
MKLQLIEKENIVSFNDDLSVGNISNCREYESRKTVIHNIFYNDKIIDKDDINIKKEFDDFYEMISKENEFAIWYSDNPRDYCNLYYLVSLLQNKDIKVVQCTKKILGNKTFFYKWVSEVYPEDLPILFKNVKRLSEQEKIVYTKKWEQLVYDNGLLRAKISEGIYTVHEYYYDDLILKIVPRKNIRIARIVGEFIGMEKPCLRDWFVVWRIKQLAAMGCLEIENRCLDRYVFNNIRKIV